eukprot:CAMPEP_0198583622 /NCGR_PEP_ID=MMETSP1462-20131121/126965_1 /TAXON_ID=1333877 /ORGANISM="Brandtodinium nutriculum, Strain RCC3387" /LENGTH=58 /DNA_ID=CAMNT_0044315037 /DNA_START=28 /DNA_END=200 /DNA_ORIENTATION=+
MAWWLSLFSSASANARGCTFRSPLESTGPRHWANALAVKARPRATPDPSNVRAWLVSR